jgi:hypothetical protein
MLSREPYIYAAPRYLVITYLTPKGQKLNIREGYPTCMQAPEYVLRRIPLPRTLVNRKRARLSAAMCSSLRRSYRTKNNLDNLREISKVTLRNASRNVLVSNARYAGLTVTHLESREGATVMQAYGAAQRGGVGTITRRGGRWLEAMLTLATILVIVAVMALMTRGMVIPADKGGVGPAIVHDDPGTVYSSLAPCFAPIHDDAGNMPATGAGAAVVHDDAGNVR